ncbi:MAG: hypothetical protein WC205_08640 [Opitutaceae bacterium]|jgi:hypothetical protein
MQKSLDRKLAELRANPGGPAFILADAKDADMAWGAASPGVRWPNDGTGRFISMQEFRDQIREIVRLGLVDIMLGSVATMDELAGHEKLFADSPVTPAVRANDATDVWCMRGASYRTRPSRPFAGADLAEVQEAGVNLGLYSATFVNDLEADLRSLEAFKTFRLDARRRGFRYFLEVFEPNVDTGLAPEAVPTFINDHISHALAAVPRDSRPDFLKIPYLGARALEELVNYDTGVIVGILGGGSGTTLDAFQLLHDAQKHGARVALFGRKIKDAEHPVTFIRHLWHIVSDGLAPVEAVKSYHAELARLKLASKRTLADDLQRTNTLLAYS